MFKDTYKRVTSIGIHIFFNHLHCNGMGSVFFILCHNEIKKRLNKQVELPWGNANGVFHKLVNILNIVESKAQVKF